MSRSIPPACLSRGLILVVVLALAASTAPLSHAAIDEYESSSDLVQNRPVLEDPEVGHPGDDDQPTIIVIRKRGTWLDGSAAAQSAAPRPERTAPPVQERLRSRWNAFVQTIVGRLRPMLW